MGGVSTVDEMQYYAKYAQKYHPDAVVLSFFLGNDTLDNSLNYEHKDAFLSSKEAWNTVPQYESTQLKSFVTLKNKIYRTAASIRFADRVVRSSPKLNSFAVKLGLYRSPVKGENGLDIISSHFYYYLDPLDAERAVFKI